MKKGRLPTREAMVTAMLTSDPAYEGIFYTAVKTTGIFCRPTCSARKPLPKNVEFFTSAEDALAGGYRPCLRCRPLDASGSAPDWVKQAIELTDGLPDRRWTDDKLSELNLDPLRLRRWFKEHYGTTFHTHIRARRLALALSALANGSTLDDAASDHGYESLSGFRDALQRTAGAPAGRARSAPLLLFCRLVTPLGPMLAMADGAGLVLLEFVDRPALAAEIRELRCRYGYAVMPGKSPHLDLVDRELATYFAGGTNTFTVPISTPGSSFQQRVWAQLRRIEYGKTITYSQIATAVDCPAGSRAVAAANGQNRIAIVIPCHRVIGADGTLIGYGGGLPRKAHLLQHEQQFLSVADRTRPFQEVLFDVKN